MTEIKPCPFCGQIPKPCFAFTTDGMKWGAVRCCCSGPEVRTNYKNGNNEPWHEKAIEAWNERA